MKRINNPFTVHNAEEYNCFGCSPNNELGLQLEFFDTGKELVTKWNPKNWLVGYNQILHGGIQATLMDEIAGWVVLTKCETAGVTTEMSIKYLKPVYITRGEIEVRSELKSFEDGKAIISCKLFDGEGECCATGEIKYFCYPEKIARRKLHYPGVEAFGVSVSE
ncbi:MAG: PaaI family thioesterase [Prolixibacteraceae bacterium]|nr:PaaI family thioesterase [Prolixibacteraceae bacterium]MBN2773694.1 PaaI family thioesterase [Prolixibacteraceae bacterium]